MQSFRQTTNCRFNIIDPLILAHGPKQILCASQPTRLFSRRLTALVNASAARVPQRPGEAEAGHPAAWPVHHRPGSG